MTTEIDEDKVHVSDDAETYFSVKIYKSIIVLIDKSKHELEDLKALTKLNLTDTQNVEEHFLNKCYFLYES